MNWEYEDCFSHRTWIFMKFLFFSLFLTLHTSLNSCVIHPSMHLSPSLSLAQTSSPPLISYSGKIQILHSFSSRVLNKWAFFSERCKKLNFVLSFPSLPLFPSPQHPPASHHLAPRIIQNFSWCSNFARISYHLIIVCFQIFLFSTFQKGGGEKTSENCGEIEEWETSNWLVVNIEKKEEFRFWW